MKRWTLSLLVPLALVACRTIVGIDDLENTGPNGPNNNNRDGGGGPGEGDITVTPIGATKIATCKASSICRQCCKNSFVPLTGFERPGGGRDCVCEPRHCKDACGDAGETCSPNPVVGAPSSGEPSACIRCIDDLLAATENTCQSACGTDRDCLDGLACLQTCDGKRP